MPHVISFINLKGGVAKTTTAVQLADTFAFMRQKKVLVLDLDPQTNATLALVGEERWEQADERGQTLAHLFLDLLNGTRNFNPERAIVRGRATSTPFRPRCSTSCPKVPSTVGWTCCRVPSA